MDITNANSKEMLDDLNAVYVNNIVNLQLPNLLKYPFYSLFYIAHGKGSVLINNQEVKIKEGDMFLINKNIPFLFKSSQTKHNITLYCCYFYENSIMDFLKNLKKDFINFNNFYTGDKLFLYTNDFPEKKLRNHLIKMIDEFLYSPTGYTYTMKCHLIVLLTEFLRKNSVSNSDHHSFPPNKTVDQTIHSLDIYSKLDLSHLADEEGVSPEYLCTIFKKYTGVTLTQYINNRRIDAIKDLLINTSRPIHMILDKFDFNPVYIKRLFKKHTGYTLREYRDKYNTSK